MKPEGAFYAMVDVSAFGVDGDTFAAKLLKEKHVAVIRAPVLGRTARTQCVFPLQHQKIP